MDASSTTDKVLEKTVEQNTEEKSQVLLPKELKDTKKTQKSFTKEDALEILASAINILQENGILVYYAMDSDSEKKRLAIILEDVKYNEETATIEYLG